MRLTPRQWQNGRRGQDGWNRWTRRRKWYRDAELVETEDVEPPSVDGTADSPQISTPKPRLPAGLAPTPAVPTVDLSPSSPSVALSPPINITSQEGRDKERDEELDSASVLSSSSRSSRFRSPILRRRATDASHRSSRSRRASVAASSEDDAAVLGTQARMALQEAGGEAGSWGVGDEVRMGLE